MADYGWICPDCGADCLAEDQTASRASSGPGVVPSLVIAPSQVDDCGQTATSMASPEGFLYCGLPKNHHGPHYDGSDELSWRVVASRAIPRITQAYLTPSADLPACRDEDPAQPATLAACYPDPPEYQHPEEL